LTFAQQKSESKVKLNFGLSLDFNVQLKVSLSESLSERLTQRWAGESLPAGEPSMYYQ